MRQSRRVPRRRRNTRRGRGLRVFHTVHLDDCSPALPLRTLHRDEIDDKPMQHGMENPT
ncbi:hypothetical protein KDW36_04025 [Burkholderia dolosa]|jgi:hypothetical protein|nr:hypothetical protein BDSB_07860 [Burkholderia dolosa PC543]MBR8312365.1 hypothetical protein [Burkholderia dolosa]MBR8457650.1 hypothetical protein [Burkholderia dolosa]